MDSYAAQVEQASLKQVGTCKLAVVAGLLSLACPVGPGGLLGLVLGFFALGQIRSSRGDLGGEAMAWLGIVFGTVQVVVVGGLLAWTSNQAKAAPLVVQTFVSAVSRGEPDEARGVMTVGLRPGFDRGVAESIAGQLREPLGEFQAVGEQRSLKVRWNDGLVVTAEYDLVFSKGAPAQASFTMVREYDSLRVRAFEVRSPVMRKPVALVGKASQELVDFSGGKAPAPKLKSFGK